MFGDQVLVSFYFSQHSSVSTTMAKHKHTFTVSYFVNKTDPLLHQIKWLESEVRLRKTVQRIAVESDESEDLEEVTGVVQRGRNSNQKNYSIPLKPIWTGNLVLEMYDGTGRIVYGVEQSRIPFIHRGNLIGAVIETSGIEIGPGLIQTISLTSHNTRVVQYGVLLNLKDELELLKKQHEREQKEERRNKSQAKEARAAAKRQLIVNINSKMDSLKMKKTNSRELAPASVTPTEGLTAIRSNPFGREAFHCSTQASTQISEIVTVTQDMALLAIKRASDIPELQRAIKRHKPNTGSWTNHDDTHTLNSFTNNQ